MECGRGEGAVGSDMTSKNIVIVGGAHGGPRAASRARQFDEEANIILVEKNEHVTWVQANIKHYLDGDATRLESQLFEREAYFAKRYNVDIQTSTEARAIDMDARCLVTEKDGESGRIPFDALIFAGGAISKRIEIPGLEGPRVTNFRNLNDLQRIKTALNDGAKKAVVLGCGPYGIGAAEVLKSFGLQVSIVEKNPRIVRNFPFSFSHAMLAELENVGIEVLLGDLVVSAKNRGKIGFRLDLDSGKTLDADLVVVAIGSLPRTDVLAQAGAALQKDGSVRVDAHMQTSLPNVFACGSAISVHQAYTNERLWIAQPAVIDRSAQIAGFNAAMPQEEMYESFHPVAGTQLLHVGSKWFARTGLSKTDARKALGDGRLQVTTLHSQSSESWLDDEALTVSIIVDKKDGRVLGGDIFGASGVDRRIDLLAVAFMEGWTADKLADIDMAYSPILGPAFDPLKEAGLLSKMALKGYTQMLDNDQFAHWMASKKPCRVLNIVDEVEKSANILPGAENWNLEELRGKLETLDRKLPIILSSNTGHRSILAQRLLAQKGFSEVYHLDGGLKSWQLMMGNPVIPA